jgi:hypothetical protein
MDIIAHQFNQVNIAQSQSDSTISGKYIPKGYVNATQLCKSNKKLLGGWNRLKESKLYIEAFSLDMQIGISNLIVELEGTPDGDASLQGTWVHPEIAIEVARWISPEFNVWANRTLRLVINGEFKPLTDEANKAEKELQVRWEKIRSTTIFTRRELTDCIKAWYDRPDTQTTCPLGLIIAQCTNQLYLAMWGVTAADIRSHFGLTKGSQLTRDCLSEKALKCLDFAEAKVIEVIDDDGAIPHKNAVEMARVRPAKVDFKD